MILSLLVSQALGPIFLRESRKVPMLRLIETGNRYDSAALD